MIIQFTLDELFKLANRRALGESDRHFTILKFSTEWKIYPGTPNLDIGKERENVVKLRGYKTLEEALKGYIMGEFYDD